MTSPESQQEQLPGEIAGLLGSIASRTVELREQANNSEQQLLSGLGKLYGATLPLTARVEEIVVNSLPVKVGRLGDQTPRVIAGDLQIGVVTHIGVLGSRVNLHQGDVTYRVDPLSIQPYRPGQHDEHPDCQ